MSIEDLNKKKEIIRKEINHFIQHLSKQHSSENDKKQKQSIKRQSDQQFWLLDKKEIKNLTDSKIQIKLDVSDLLPQEKSPSVSPTLKTPRTIPLYNQYRFKQNKQELQKQYMARPQVDSTRKTLHSDCLEHDSRTQHQQINSIIDMNRYWESDQIGQNQNQKNLINSKRDHTPIYKRYREEVQKKEDKLQLMRDKQNKIQEINLQSLSFQPNSSKKKDENRTFDEFLNDQIEWSNLKDGHIQFLTNQKDIQNHQSHSTQVLVKSQKINDKQSNYFCQFRKPEDRLLDYKIQSDYRLETQRREQIPLFKPLICDRSKRLAQNRINRKVEESNSNPPRFH